MATRKIEVGEKINTGRLDHPRTAVHEKGYAVSVAGLTGGRIAVGDSLGRVQKRIIDRELHAARMGCPLGDSCEIEAVTPNSDDALPSEAIFKCPRSGEVCEMRVLRAAEGADRQIASASSVAAEAIGKLGPDA